jgi:hypothetical protein
MSAAASGARRASIRSRATNCARCAGCSENNHRALTCSARNEVDRSHRKASTPLWCGWASAQVCLSRSTLTYSGTGAATLWRMLVTILERSKPGWVTRTSSTPYATPSSLFWYRTNGQYMPRYFFILGYPDQEMMGDPNGVMAPGDPRRYHGRAYRNECTPGRAWAGGSNPHHGGQERSRRDHRPPWTIDDWCGKPGWPSATDMLTKTRGDVSQQI